MIRAIIESGLGPCRPSAFTSTVGIIAATLAAATIWLLLTDPVTVADAVNEQDVTPFVRQLAQVLYDAVVRLARYL